MRKYKIFAYGVFTGIIISVTGFTGIFKLLDFGVEKIKKTTSNVLLSQVDEEFLKQNTIIVKASPVN